VLDSITRERVESGDQRKQVVCIAKEKIRKRLTGERKKENEKQKNKLGPRNRYGHQGMTSKVTRLYS